MADIYNELRKKEQQIIDNEVDKILDGAKKAFNQAKDQILPDLEHAIFTGLCSYKKYDHETLKEKTDSLINLASISPYNTKAIIDQFSNDPAFNMEYVAKKFQNLIKERSNEDINKALDLDLNSKNIENEVKNIISKSQKQSADFKRAEAVNANAKNIIKQTTQDKYDNAATDADKNSENVKKSMGKMKNNPNKIPEEIKTAADNIVKNLQSNLSPVTLPNIDNDKLIKGIVDLVVSLLLDQIKANILNMVEPAMIPAALSSIDTNALSMVPKVIVETIFKYLNNNGLLESNFNFVKENHKFDGDIINSYKNLSATVDGEEFLIAQQINNNTPKLEIKSSYLTTKKYNNYNLIETKYQKDELYMIIGDKKFLLSTIKNEIKE